jgi:hypothetical protein
MNLGIFYLNNNKGLDTLKIQIKFETSFLGGNLVQNLPNCLEFFHFKWLPPSFVYYEKKSA